MIAKKPTYEDLMQEVLELKKTKAALKESEEKFRLLFEHSADGQVLYKGDQFIDCNQASLEMLGFENRGQLLKLHPADISPEQQPDGQSSAVKAELMTALALEKGHHRFEWLCLRSDGSNLLLNILLNVIRIEKETVIHGVWQDITRLKQEEDALRENEQRYKSAQRMGLVGNWEYDLVTGKFWGSDEAKRIYGLDPKEETFTVDTVEKCILDRDRVHQALVDLIEKEKPYDLDFEIQPITRQERKVIRSIAELVKNDAGLPIKVIGVIQDVTRRKQAESKTADTEKRLREAQRIAQVGDWDWDPVTNSVTWSEQLYRIFSLDSTKPPPDYQGQLQLYHPEDATQLNEAVSKALKDKTPYELELRRTNPDGQEIHLLARGETETDQFGRVVRLFGSVQDITARKVNEVRLVKSEERYRTLFENAPFPYQSLDKDGCFLEVNKRWLDHLGYSQKEVVGKSFGDFLHPDWQDHFRENFPRFKSIGEVMGIEFQLKKKDGTYVWVAFDGKITRDLDGQFIQTHCIFNDISEQKRLQDKVKMQNEALNQSQKLQAVGRLAGGIAHDFNNMLSIILGHAELAMENLESSDPLYGDMEDIYQAAMRSADITRQLLAFARKQTVAPKVLNLNDSIGSMLKMLRHLIGENINFAWVPATELWTVKIDPSQVDQILANLCVNARDAITDIGKVTIETKNFAFDEAYCADHPETFPGEYIMLAVSDDGCGIVPEVIEQVFEPFFTTKEMGKGTGLGLATVYGIVKQNNGFISVYSEPMKGTTIRVYLPRHVQTVKEQKKSVPETPLSKGETILLVEDDASILKLGVRIIERMGYKVLSTTSPKKAKSIAEGYGGQIDLLITDVVMPEMNGRELSEQLQHLYPQIKILFMSGYTANVIAHQGILDEGVHFISKPFFQKEIAIKIREVLD
ncbi:PAS domain-containing sensor histidine kinase [Desulforhopalus sp. IMCC35007]|uniref:PAS domain-containing hybrid sensor histidine kinase/response regulator n=1 Tax=Desulforhopalus sp. IMCC35007 TaxID=2569543 RepID=UPI0010AE3D23|nr:PAS domain-containing sensor histidine kinase [Desulforhopalus sp. IMCC35007]TKB09605.1 PAS domain S-box protein [Desulforhopalus sp. IMCC35007]